MASQLYGWEERQFNFVVYVNSTTPFASCHLLDEREREHLLTKHDAKGNAADVSLMNGLSVDFVLCDAQTNKDFHSENVQNPTWFFIDLIHASTVVGKEDPEDSYFYTWDLYMLDSKNKVEQHLVNDDCPIIMYHFPELTVRENNRLLRTTVKESKRHQPMGIISKQYESSAFTRLEDDNDDDDDDFFGSPIHLLLERNNYELDMAELRHHYGICKDNGTDYIMVEDDEDYDEDPCLSQMLIRAISEDSMRKTLNSLNDGSHLDDYDSYPLRYNKLTGEKNRLVPVQALHDYVQLMRHRHTRVRVMDVRGQKLVWRLNKFTDTGLRSQGRQFHVRIRYRVAVYDKMKWTAKQY